MRNLLKKFGPSVAFGVPGGLMLLATWVFWLGRKKFAHIPPAGTASVREALSGDGLTAITLELVGEKPMPDEWYEASSHSP